jgi:hypothetical protein
LRVPKCVRISYMSKCWKTFFIINCILLS